eukprot:CAMPEP_0176414336 /NCGR_PEP_ID=MMETSP0127-20121128/5205_1 /TAXON_ID=938130 /ORGANISM="Platyophrya macrostoma, Strain WH" /LENGTH=35 /DNA_ID= /DNA_START= /DNA_END= /DNA_ORIENTATION=
MAAFFPAEKETGGSSTHLYDTKSPGPKSRSTKEFK